MCLLIATAVTLVRVPREMGSENVIQCQNQQNMSQSLFGLVQENSQLRVEELKPERSMLRVVILLLNHSE
jgi:hypothetical protein